MSSLIAKLGENFSFREGTIDRSVFESVFREDEYRIPQEFDPLDHVIDIGAHIGSFSAAAAVRGCRSIYAIEPNAENFAISASNLNSLIECGVLELVRAAAWRSDHSNDTLKIGGYRKLNEVSNTGGGVVWTGFGDPIEAISLDEIIMTATKAGKKIRFLKLDCEGSEWPILYTCTKLNLVEEIALEFHEIGEFGEFRTDLAEIFAKWDCTPNALCHFLESQGFQVEIVRRFDPAGHLLPLGLMFARRSSAD